MIERKKVKAARVLVVPGLHDSGPEHWQSRWETLYQGFERVQQARWDQPNLALWSGKLRRTLAQRDTPTLIVAHSFGCLATVHQASLGPSPIVGALLVAPADPDKFGIDHQLEGLRLPFPSIVVGSTNDPWMRADRAQYWALAWGSQFVNGGALGHINAESDLGYWMFGLALLQQLVQTLPEPLSLGGPRAGAQALLAA